MTSRDTERWLKPGSVGVSRMEILRHRHIVKRAVRDYLHNEDFLEIDIPLLVRGTTPDAAIESFAVEDRYLSTSAEYQIKRMEIGGFGKLYSLTQNFRRGDRGRFRNPEFTMLEWARVGGTLRQIEEDVERFTVAAHRALGGNGVILYQGKTINLAPPWDRLGVIDAVEKYTGVRMSGFTPPDMIRALDAAKIPVNDDWHNDTTFLFTVLLDHIQQFLGFEKPVFLCDWPNFLTSSAQEHESGRYTERSELFIAGVEISDGFPSLTDARRQRENFSMQLARRAEAGMEPVALDEKYLSAMDEGMPAGAGMALGFDRLVMILTDCADISGVLAFNWDEL